MKITKYILGASSALTLLACQPKTVSDIEVKLETETDSLSYSVGILMAENLGKTFDVINPEVLAKAIHTVISEEEQLLEKEEAGAFMQEYQKRMMAEEMENMKIENAPKIESEEKFLAENAKKDGVTTTESGLQYEVLKQGSGAKPLATDRVKVDYTGTFIDGKVFDSSVDRGEPATFAANQVIAGWTEALQLMPVGSKWKLYIPYNLAYGEQGRGGIPPFSALIFEVELLDIVK